MNPFVIAFRRIIYSIPLKRLLLGLAVFGFLFVGFSNADDINVPTSSWQGNINDYNGLFDYVHERFNYGSTTLHLFVSDSLDFVCLKRRDNNNGAQYSFDGVSWYNTFNFEWGCTNKKNFYIKGDTLVTYFKFGEGFIPLVYDSSRCQTEFNLIPINSVDQNYCTTNNLCPSNGTPSDCPNVGVSNLYINDIFHPGAFNVIMNIPEEIDWDYAYTNSGQNFNIDVVGYNQDFDKIEGWIETNNYKPTSDDFTNIFKNFSNFGGLLVGALFVILVFYFVKKMFK